MTSTRNAARFWGEVFKEGLINSVFGPTSSEITGDSTGLGSKLRINQTFLKTFAIWFRFLPKASNC